MSIEGQLSEPAMPEIVARVFERRRALAEIDTRLECVILRRDLYDEAKAWADGAASHQDHSTQSAISPDGFDYRGIVWRTWGRPRSSGSKASAVVYMTAELRRMDGTVAEVQP